MMNKWPAYELFGEMRNSTQKERKEYEDMLLRYSLQIDDINNFNIFDIDIKEGNNESKLSNKY